MSDMSENKQLDDLLTTIFKLYAYDFRNYAKASLMRRIGLQMDNLGLGTMAEFRELLQHDPQVFDLFLKTMSVTVTDMFRNPVFYTQMRHKVIPQLKSWYKPKIWSAGCATGEEVYSLAIVLAEEALTDCQIYATDYNRYSLEVAREGIYPLDRMKGFSQNYHSTGGQRSLADYYHASYNSAKMSSRLIENVLFSHHNLVTDGSFGDMQLIVCRNVLIYFDNVLQDRVLKLFSDSLSPGGFLCLGDKESLDFVSVSNYFEPVAKKERVFRKRLR